MRRGEPLRRGDSCCCSAACTLLAVCAKEEKLGEQSTHVIKTVSITLRACKGAWCTAKELKHCAVRR